MHSVCPRGSDRCSPAPRSARSSRASPAAPAEVAPVAEKDMWHKKTGAEFVVKEIGRADFMPFFIGLTCVSARRPASLAFAPTPALASPVPHPPLERVASCRAARSSPRAVR